YLVLVVVLQPVGVLAIAAVLRSARGLDVGGAPRFGPDRAQEGGRVEGAGADLHVVRLEQRAALAVPVLLESQDDSLEGEHGGRGVAPRGSQTGILAFSRRRPAPHAQREQERDGESARRPVAEAGIGRQDRKSVV